MNNAKRVPMRPGAEQKSYYKYYLQDFVKIPEERLEILKDPIKPMEDGLKITDRNKLFEPGYLKDEIGVFPTEEGGWLVSNRTFFEGCNGEMFKWWFAWHALDPLRYAIWDPFDHYGLEISFEDRAKIMDPNVPLQEKSWDVWHIVDESMIMGDDSMICNIIFRNPKDMGYDVEKIGTDACSFMVAANCITPTPFGLMPSVMTHMTRDIEGGCELRSRFWLGYNIVKGEGKFLIPEGAQSPKKLALDLLEHNINEYSNLAAILPKVYAEEKDNW